MNFHKIVRGWCKIYKAMLDNEDNGNRRFYLTDSTAGVVEMVKNISDKFNPFVIMESDVDGSGPFTRPEFNYPIYFFVKAEKMADGDEAFAAKEEALMHCKKFMTWLRQKREEDLTKGIDGDFACIDLENTYVTINSTGPLENGWYGVLLQISRTEPLDLCVDPHDYDDNEDNGNNG